MRNTMNEEQQNEKQDTDAIMPLIGLAKLPPETNLKALTKLDISSCGLDVLPAALPLAVPQLSILFASNNSFAEMPSIIGSCPHLQMVAFKSNGMASIHPDALQRQLRWLILTDNCLTELPETIGRCTQLKKCMLSGNKLKSLPPTFSQCTQLELLRLACNQLEELPTTVLAALPNLAWLALSDNPCLPAVPSVILPTIDDCTLGEVLGRGAGGTTYAATRRTDGSSVAVKIPPTSSSVTSDGRPGTEHAVHAYVSQGLLGASADGICPLVGRCSESGGVVMPLLERRRALAGPPSLDSCTRDVYRNETTPIPNAATILSVMIEVLLALQTQLHVCHGDLYAHNILVAVDDDASGSTPPVLTDWGAAYYYGTERLPWLERMERRALAVLAEELGYPELAVQCRSPTATMEAVHIWWMQQERLPSLAQDFATSLAPADGEAQFE